jgi:type II secretory pathway pseudopilin PulG
MKRIRGRAGFSFLETLFALALACIVIGGLVAFGGPLALYFRQARQRQEINSEGRNTADTISHYLQEGLALSAKRCSCTLASAAYPSCTSVPCGLSSNNSTNPFSRIEFSLQNGTIYQFYWANDGVQMDVSNAGGQLYHQTLAHHVTALTFSGDSQDPAVVNVDIHMTNNDDPKHPSSALIQTQAHMIATP